MATAEGGHLNEVDLGAVGALVEKIRQRPSAAQTTWSAEIRWTGAFRSEAAVRKFAPIASDEPRGMGGTDSAPNRGWSNNRTVSGGSGLKRLGLPLLAAGTPMGAGSQAGAER